MLCVIYIIACNGIPFLGSDMLATKSVWNTKANAICHFGEYLDRESQEVGILGRAITFHIVYYELVDHNP